MQFHLPKPMHGWREFAGEVAIIVLGVLIALGAEQMVHSFNDRSAADEARQNIRAELAINIGRMQNADSRAACLALRLNQIALLLDQARKGRSLTDVKWIGRPPIWEMEDQRWQSATSAGRSSMFSADEQAAIGDVYALMADYELQDRIEQEAWAKLRGLVGLETLSEARDVSLSDALQQARYSQWILNIDFKQAQDGAKKLGIRATPVRWAPSSLCIPTDVPAAEALKRLDSQYGEPL